MENRAMKVQLQGENKALIAQSAKRIIALANKNSVKTSHTLILPFVKHILAKPKLYRCSILIFNPTPKTADELMYVNLPDDVEITIRL